MVAGISNPLPPKPLVVVSAGTLVLLLLLLEPTKRELTLPVLLSPLAFVATPSLSDIEEWELCLPRAANEWLEFDSAVPLDSPNRFNKRLERVP